MHFVVLSGVNVQSLNPEAFTFHEVLFNGREYQLHQGDCWFPGASAFLRCLEQKAGFPARKIKKKNGISLIAM